MNDTTPATNVPEFSVSDLAFSLKQTLESTYGHVRVRGELTGVKLAASGHLYGDIKDEGANINIVCWRGVMGRLAVKPEDGLEVIVTGKLSSYPKSSRYQLVIESMELAGEGALLKMLEERKKKLTEEGLFAAERKKPLPFIPQRIGVVTSPTGAVIRDIMHRLRDRFPSHVLVWPVLVQGKDADKQITAAIRGFDALDTAYKPDLLIVARGGGSLEDLMAFNEENVVRAVAECSIPVISAVGHETDTTLIDYAADVRAPTPTGAAEIAVPVRANLMAQILDDEKRLMNAANRGLDHARQKLETMSAKLGDPARLLEIKTQNLDHLSQNLTNAFKQGLARKDTHIREQAARLRHPQQMIAEKTRILALHGAALNRLAPSLFREQKNRLDSAGRMLESLSFKKVLTRGYVVVQDEKGHPLTMADQTHNGQAIALQFQGEKMVDATIGKNTEQSPKKPVSKKKPRPKEQGQLF